MVTPSLGNTHCLGLLKSPQHPSSLLWKENRWLKTHLGPFQQRTFFVSSYPLSQVFVRVPEESLLSFFERISVKTSWLPRAIALVLTGELVRVWQLQAASVRVAPKGLGPQVDVTTRELPPGHQDGPGHTGRTGYLSTSAADFYFYPDGKRTIFKV